MNQIRFYRGTAAPTKTAAIKAGLSMINESSRFASDIPNVHGGMFYVDAQPYTIANAEEWAIDIAQKENKTACVIDISLTSQNRGLLQGRISKVKIGSGKGNDGLEYEMIDLYQNLNELKGVVTINLSGIPHDELSRVGLKVGFDDGEEKFEYKLYEEWTQILGVRNETREGLRNISGHGRPRPWRA